MNGLLNLFLSRPRPPVVLKGQALPAGVQDQPPVGTFVTLQALATFPGATTVIAGLSKIIAFIGGFHSHGTKNLTIVIGLIVGLIIFLASTISDDRVKPRGRIEWITTIFLGIVNTLFLIAAALGIPGVFGAGKT
jgi:hypothetical protein